MPHSDALANLEIGDAAYTEFGILMVGQDEITGVAGVLASPDGINWQREASLDDGLQDDDDAAIPKALASLELLLVLIGSTYGNDSVFWYANEPSVWGVGDPKPVFDLGKEPVDVVAVEDRFIAANNNSGHGVVRTTYEGALLFASETGRTWREVASFPNAEISSLFASETGRTWREVASFPNAEISSLARKWLDIAKGQSQWGSIVRNELRPFGSRQMALTGPNHPLLTASKRRAWMLWLLMA